MTFLKILRTIGVVACFGAAIFNIGSYALGDDRLDMVIGLLFLLMAHSMIQEAE